MSNSYDPSPSHPHESIPVSDINGLGIAGFIVSLAGIIVTCGLLCPIGLLISLFALFKPPRGFAIAGAVIGAIGTLLLVFWGFAIVAGVMGLRSTVTEVKAMAVTTTTLAAGQQIIERHRVETDELPDGIEGNKLLVDLADGWGNSIRYEVEEQTYVLRSGGQDAAFDTDDDITINSSGQITNSPEAEDFFEGKEEF